MIPIPWYQVMPPWYQNHGLFQSGMTWHDFREIDMLLRCQGKLSTSVTSAVSRCMGSRRVSSLSSPQKCRVLLTWLTIYIHLPSNHFSFASKCFKVVSSFRQNFSFFFAFFSFPLELVPQFTISVSQFFLQEIEIEQGKNSRNNMEQDWLAVWNMFYDFPETVGNGKIIPTDFHSLHHFSEG